MPYLTFHHKSGSFTSVVRSSGAGARSRLKDYTFSGWWLQRVKVPRQMKVPSIIWAYAQKASIQHSGPIPVRKGKS